MQTKTALRNGMVLLLLWLLPVSGGRTAAPAVEPADGEDPPSPVREITLEECYRTAKQNSIAIRGAEQDLKIAALKSENARVVYWPSLSVGMKP